MSGVAAAFEYGKRIGRPFRSAAFHVYNDKAMACVSQPRMGRNRKAWGVSPGIGPESLFHLSSAPEGGDIEVADGAAPLGLMNINAIAHAWGLRPRLYDAAPLGLRRI